MLHFSTRNNCCEFLGFYGVNTQSVIQSFLKTPVCGASLTQQSCMFLPRLFCALLYDEINDLCILVIILQLILRLFDFLNKKI